MKFGITQYAASADGKGFVEATARLKLAGVEPYIGSSDSEFFAWSPQEIERVVQQASKLGVVIPSVCVGLFNGDPAVISADGFEKAVRLTSDALKFTAAVGGKIMLLCTYVVSHPDTPQKKKNLLRVVRAVEPLARKLGVKIGLETPLSAEELAQVVDEAASDHVGVYYDYGNALANGFDPAREIPILGKRILSIHVKDSARMVLGSLHLGSGDVNLAAAVAATLAIGYDGWLMLETPGGDESAIREDLAVLNRHLKTR